MSELINETETRLQPISVFLQKVGEFKQKHSVVFEMEIKTKSDYLLVDNARKEAKSEKVAIEKIRKELKADALKYGQLVDSTAREVSTPFEQFESELTDKQKIYDDALARIKFLEIQKSKLPERMKTLSEITLEKTEDQILELSDTEFNQLVFDRKSELQQIESARLAEIAENQRLAQLAIDNENKRIADEKQRAIDIAEAEKKAAEKAKEKAEFESSEKIRLAELAQKQAEDKAAADILKAQEDAQKAIKDAADKAEADRKEAEHQAQVKTYLEQKAEAEKQRLANLAPDKEKLALYIKKLRETPKPEGLLPESEIKFGKFALKMADAIKEIS